MLLSRLLMKGSLVTHLHGMLCDLSQLRFTVTARVLDYTPRM